MYIYICLKQIISKKSLYNLYKIDIIKKQKKKGGIHMKIMFVCTGNICRSAMAEAMCKKMLKDKNVEVYSCGTMAYTGDECTQNAIEVMEEYNIDITKHKATNVKDSKIEEMDLILCATITHKQILIQMCPNLKEKIYTIKEYAQKDEEKKDKNLNISDPWGYSVEVYRNCAKEIEENLKKIIEKI